MRLKGMPQAVLSHGNLVIEGGEYVGTPGEGRFLKRGTHP